MREYISIASDLFTIGASGIAIYLFFVKGKEIATALHLLSKYAYQTTLLELRGKLERLNEYNASEASHYEEIINVFHEISGQINGHPKLKVHFAEFTTKLEKATSGKRRITEPMKRALVSELREGIKHLDVDSFEEIMGNKQ